MTQEREEASIKDRVLVRSKEILVLADQRVLSAAPTSFTTQGVPVQAFRNFTLYLRILSASTPTTIQFFVEFLEPRSGLWHRYVQGLFASLIYEDTITATEINEVFSGDCAGREMRVVAVGVGTDATKKFTFSIAAEFWN